MQLLELSPENIYVTVPIDKVLVDQADIKILQDHKCLTKHITKFYENALKFNSNFIVACRYKVRTPAKPAQSRKASAEAGG